MTTDEEPLTLTWFRHTLDARDGKRIPTTRAELAAQLAGAAPMRGVKGDLPLVCMATFAGNHRGNARVEVVNMLGLDIDERQADPHSFVGRLAQALGGVEVFAYSTASSEPGAFKMRALVPYDRPATSEEHRLSWAVVAAALKLQGIIIDRSCCDPARGFYVWAVPANGAYFSEHLAGCAWPVGAAAERERARQKVLDEARRQEAARRPERPVSAMRAEDRARRYVGKMPGAISGSRGHDATWRVARRLVADFDLPDEIALDIFRDYNARCEPPWSEKELLHKLKQAKAARVRVEMNR